MDTRWRATEVPQGSFVQLNVQAHGGCAMRTDGTATCWGDNYFFPSGAYASLGAPYGIRPDPLVALRTDNQFTLPTGTFVEVSGESTGGCGRRSDDTLACWGNNFTERLKPPSDTFAQVRLGFTLACGIRRDNQIVCWGDDSDGQSTAVSGTFRQISTSGAGSGGSTAGIHACAIKADQTVQCWGDVGTPFPGISVAQLAAAFKQVLAGPRHACGILADDSLACWSNAYSPSGPPTGSFTRLATAGFDFTCAISSAGALACWGDLPTGLPKSPAGSYKAIASPGPTPVPSPAMAVCLVGERTRPGRAPLRAAASLRSRRPCLSPAQFVATAPWLARVTTRPARVRHPPGCSWTWRWEPRWRSPRKRTVAPCQPTAK